MQKKKKKKKKKNGLVVELLSFSEVCSSNTKLQWYFLLWAFRKSLSNIVFGNMKVILQSPQTMSFRYILCYCLLLLISCWLQIFRQRPPSPYYINKPCTCTYIIHPANGEIKEFTLSDVLFIYFFFSDFKCDFSCCYFLSIFYTAKYVLKMNLTNLHVCLMSHRWDTGKQYRPRSDAVGRSFWSGFTLFALDIEI